jgi:hypothetical protein
MTCCAKRTMNFEQTLGIVLLTLPAAFAGSLHETVEGEPGFEHVCNLEYDQACADFSSLAARDPSSANTSAIRQILAHPPSPQTEWPHSEIVSATSPYATATVTDGDSGNA